MSTEPAAAETTSASAAPAEGQRDFVRQIIRDDLATGKHHAIRTRFPPEPNGYLHIGHAKAICLNFGIAREFAGWCNLRLDDTNPGKEDPEFVEGIKDDVRWLGYEWHDLRHASDYFEVFYLAAVKLIEDGHAYVDDLNAEEMRDYRGTLTAPGRNSPHRERSVAENLDLFRRMREGEFADGAKTLRAKIDMASGNINMRDPAIYRIRRIPHQNTGDAWPIYPMYDYAHCLSDALEGITHSLCTLEFEDHRPLYDWFVDKVDLVNHPELWTHLREGGFKTEPAKPRQIEFSRLNLSYCITSKRKLAQLVNEGLVDGWDDPRMNTLRGLRRRGFTPGGIRLLIERLGVSKQNSLIDYAIFENCVREDLDGSAPRRMAVLDPLKLTITNLPEGHEENLSFSNHPKDESFGTRTVPFARELWIEREDFAEVPPKGFHRLKPEGEVRLRGVGIVKCEELVKDAAGNVIELRCTLDLDSRQGMPGADRKVKGTIHWVSARHAVAAEVRVYDRLFNVAAPDDDSDSKSWIEHINPEAKRIVQAWLEPSAAAAAPEQRFQFERLGYFVADRVEHKVQQPVFNRTVTLRDTWAKQA
ncbi:glutamine--tRNA ligase/YqeY domain fusion protein [Dyella sp. LX-66]|uniref:glutamine--tRNA ligase/YqeY domain fusion protein n=1 Tax=unclassified Dyella TaxID=2634549 RepID=UPI001BDFFDCA|nr:MULTISPECIES: glutamine--tRNA ligase/YqeY domain fusion protein [unclassified Dyella]MBT2116165.1 glutamine--tRNA ligase/YqeY domain fusion protein [Dyella sp. LX-1]MBT2138175.1 glutamine--tRNA ligase/YqeY domain fusion protein [Dyella sp. LX-66]